MLPRERSLTEITTDAERKTQRLTQIKKLSALVGATDAFNLAVIFGCYLEEHLLEFLENYGKYCLFPLAAALSCTDAIIAWRTLAVEGRNSKNLYRLTIELISALMITVAVIGGLTAADIFSFAAAVIFTLVVGYKAFHSANSASYYFGKYKGSENAVDKQVYSQEIQTHSINTVLGTLVAIALATVMAAHLHSYAFFGVVGGVGGTVAGIHRYRNANKAAAVADVSEEDGLLMHASSERDVSQHSQLVLALGGPQTHPAPALPEHPALRVPFQTQSAALQRIRFIAGQTNASLQKQTAPAQNPGLRHSL